MINPVFVETPNSHFNSHQAVVSQESLHGNTHLYIIHKRREDGLCYMNYSILDHDGYVIHVETIFYQMPEDEAVEFARDYLDESKRRREEAIRNSDFS